MSYIVTALFHFSFAFFQGFLNQVNDIEIYDKRMFFLKIEIWGHFQKMEVRQYENVIQINLFNLLIRYGNKTNLSRTKIYQGISEDIFGGFI